MDVKASCKLHKVQHFLIIQEPDGIKPVLSQLPPTTIPPSGSIKIKSKVPKG